MNTLQYAMQNAKKLPSQRLNLRERRFKQLCAGNEFRLFQQGILTQAEIDNIQDRGIDLLSLKPEISKLAGLLSAKKLYF